MQTTKLNIHTPNTGINNIDKADSKDKSQLI